MVATASVNTIRKDLLFAPRKLAAIQWPYSVPLITTMKNPTTGGLVIPDNGYVVGAHRKQRGGALANAQTYNDIMIHGSGSPAMKIPTERRFSVGIEPVELNRINLQNWLGADYSGVVPDAAGGVHLPVPSLPINMLSRVALIGRHDYNGLPAWIVWFGNRTGVSETSEQSATDSEVLSFPYQFDFQDVDELDGEPLFVEIFGPGWDAMCSNADAGFYPALSSISLDPATVALTLGGGVNSDKQLKVTDSNGRDRTDDAVYSSADPAKVAVSQHGVISAVAATAAATNEVQTVTVAGTGNYKLGLEGFPDQTVNIVHNAANTAVQAALVTVVGAGNVTVAGSAGGPYTVTFQGDLAGTNVPQLTVDNTGMSGGTVSTATTTQGTGPVKVTAALQGKSDSTLVTVTA